MPTETQAAWPAPILLAPNQVDHYWDEGYLVLRHIFAPHEVAALADDVDRVLRERTDLVDPHNMRVRFRPHWQTGEPVFEVFDPISDLSPVAHSIAHDPRLLEALHELYGEPAELFKDKLIYKLPSSTGTALHQDWISWPGFPESFLTLIVAIDPFTADSGPTEVFPRLHQQGYLSAKDRQHHQLDAASMWSEPVSLLLEPGDVAIFTCFTPHRAAPNTTGVTRRGFFISYNARSEGGQQYAKHYQEYHAWIRAKAPDEKRPLLLFR
jgi:hypothetical protein